MAKGLLDFWQLQAVARLFEVLAEPTRLDIFHDAGLLVRKRDGNQVFYSIADPMIFELCALVCGKLKKDAQQQLAAFGKIK